MPPKRGETKRSKPAAPEPETRRPSTQRPKTRAPLSATVHEQIVASLSSGVLAMDAAGCVLTANAAAAQIIGLEPEALAPGASLAAHESALHFIELAREVERGTHAVQRREIEVEADGARRILGITASALQGPDAFNGVIFLFTDLSLVRNLERRAELNKQLAQIGELTAGVVHELRNPMSVISGMSELILRRLPPEHPQTRQAELIFQEAQQIERLISQFLSFAKPFEARLTRCTAEPIADRAIQLVERAAKEKSVALASIVDADLPHFQADAPKIAQALGNLLRNAIEAVPTGGEVRLVVVADDGIAFRIEDNGPGIHLHPGEDLLNPFFSKKEGGTGLGLNIVHRIVTAHGGTVTYGNRPEGGAFFKVGLPIQYGR